MKQLAMGNQVPWYCENKKIVMFLFSLDCENHKSNIVTANLDLTLF